MVPFEDLVLAPHGWGPERLFVGPCPRTPVVGPFDDLVLWALGRGDGAGLTSPHGALPHLPEWR